MLCIFPILTHKTWASEKIVLNCKHNGWIHVSIQCQCFISLWISSEKRIEILPFVVRLFIIMFVFVWICLLPFFERGQEAYARNTQMNFNHIRLFIWTQALFCELSTKQFCLIFTLLLLHQNSSTFTTGHFKAMPLAFG